MSGVDFRHFVDPPISGNKKPGHTRPGLNISGPKLNHGHGREAPGFSGGGVVARQALPGICRFRTSVLQLLLYLDN